MRIPKMTGTLASDTGFKTDYLKCIFEAFLIHEEVTIQELELPPDYFTEALRITLLLCDISKEIEALLNHNSVEYVVDYLLAKPEFKEQQ